MSALDSILVTAVGDAWLDAGRVAVSSSSSVPPGPGFLCLEGHRGQQNVAVRIERDAAIPPEVVLVSESVLRQAAYTPDAPWRLLSIKAGKATHLRLEAVQEDRPDVMWRDVHNDETLLGRILSESAARATTPLRLGEREFVVRSLEPADESVLEIGPATEIELFLPGSRTGLDVVVLADTSGSMEVDDLPRLAESSRWSGGASEYEERIDALRQALFSMLDMRLRISGRESRMALLRFASNVTQVFPRSEGMAVVDADSPPETIQELRDAIHGLTPSGATDLPEAILRGVEVLDQFGKVGNDQLIVLVSDGKSWLPKGSEFTGEVVVSKDDPVSLVEHLHKSRKVRFHAVGISNRELYDAWCRRTRRDYHESLAPDHPLLQEIVRVGGGDPSAIGGVDVLVDYFSGLGSGLRRWVGPPSTSERGFRLGEEALLAARAARSRPRGDTRTQDTERLANAIDRLNRICRQTMGRRIGVWVPFENQVGVLDMNAFLGAINGEADLLFPVKQLFQIMTEDGPGRRTKAGQSPPDELQPAYTAFTDFIKNRLNPLRHYLVHDKTNDPKTVEGASRVYQHYLQQPALDRTDAGSCMKLWCLLLADAADTTEAAIQALSSSHADGIGQPTAPTPPAASPLGRLSAIGSEQELPDFDETFDLRVRD